MGKYKREPRKLVTIWLGLSAFMGLLVYPMSLLMPLNKKLYSSSFTLCVVGISGTCLTGLYLLVDVLPSVVPRVQRGVKLVTSPLRWLGLNPLAVFVLMDVTAIVMLFYIKIDGVSLWREFFRHAFSSWIGD